MDKGKIFRILLAKPGLDGHDRGAKYLAMALRDNGYEVIYTGIRSTPEEIAAAAVMEDVDLVGLSSLSGAHLKLFPQVVIELKNRGAAAIPVIGGGVIPDEDIELLKNSGLSAIFTPGASLASILQTVKEICTKKSNIEIR